MGYRVVLTYNLLLRHGRAASGNNPYPGLVGSLARCLDEHFAAADGPDRLIYLLDHEYKRRGLDSSCLKGADARCVALLKAAADRAGCEMVLALADVHETRSAYESDEQDRSFHPSRYGRWDDWDGDDEVCASTPSGDLEPYSSEYEGYMGNWGNTLDRWHHAGRWSFGLGAEPSPYRLRHLRPSRSTS